MGLIKELLQEEMEMRDRQVAEHLTLEKNLGISSSINVCL